MRTKLIVGSVLAAAVAAGLYAKGLPPFEASQPGHAAPRATAPAR